MLHDFYIIIYVQFCRRTIPHWREGCTRAMPERCSVSTVNTTRSTSKHFKTPLTRLIGQAFALLCYLRSCMPLLPWHSALSFLFFFSALLTKAYQTAAVLFEVLKAVNVSQSVEVDQAVRKSFLVPHWLILSCPSYALPYNFPMHLLCL